MTSDDDLIIPGLTIDELDRLLSEPWVKGGGLHGHGDANLRAWLLAGRPSAALDRLCVSGSPAAVKLVRGLVGRLPAAVAWHLVEHIAISWIDPGLGLTGPWPTPPARPEGRVDMAFEVSERNLGLVAHELAHAFTRDPELFADLSSAEIEELDEMIRERTGAAERAERAYLTEEAADALASLWLGETVNTRGTRERSRRLATQQLREGGDR